VESIVARNAFLIALLVLFVLVCAPLITPVAMGGVFAILFWPVLQWMERVRVPERLGALVVTLAFSLLVLLPLTILVIFSARSGFELFKQLQSRWQVNPPLAPGQDWTDVLAQQPWLSKWVQKLGGYFPIKGEELLSTAADALKLAGIKLGEFLGGFVGKVPGMVLAVVVIIVSLYFFLVDGRRLVQFAKKNSFFESKQTDQLLQSLASMARSVIFASVLGGVVQTLIMVLGLAIVGYPNLGLIGFLVFLTSFIPLVGSAPVTFGVTLLAWSQLGSSSGSVILASAILTSVADNLVRPWVLKGGANLHPLIGFIAAFGGLQLLGLSGLFLGPIVAGLFMTVVTLHSKQ
jgi:predicted PurR-regulated permease PerM